MLIRRASPAGPGIAETLDKMINSDKRKWLVKRRGRLVGCESACCSPRRYYPNPMFPQIALTAFVVT